MNLNTLINGLVVLLTGLVLWVVADKRQDIRHVHNRIDHLNTRIDSVLLSKTADARQPSPTGATANENSPAHR